MLVHIVEIVEIVLVAREMLVSEAGEVINSR